MADIEYNNPYRKISDARAALVKYAFYFVFTPLEEGQTLKRLLRYGEGIDIRGVKVGEHEALPQGVNMEHRSTIDDISLADANEGLLLAAQRLVEQRLQLCQTI